MKNTGLRILLAMAWFYLGFYTARFALHFALRIMTAGSTEEIPHWVNGMAILDSILFAAVLSSLAWKGYFPMPRLLFTEEIAKHNGIVEKLQLGGGVAAMFVAGMAAHIGYFVATDSHNVTIAQLRENTRSRTEQILNANGQNLIDAIYPNVTFQRVSVHDVSLSAGDGRGVTWAFSAAFYWKSESTGNGQCEAIIYRTQDRFDGVKLVNVNGPVKADWEPAVLALLENEFPHNTSAN